MGFYLAGRHDETIDYVIEFLQGYLEKMKLAKLSKLHVVYFALNFTMKNMLGEKVDWKTVLNETMKDIESDPQSFRESVEKILNEFREEIKEKIRRGELV